MENGYRISATEARETNRMDIIKGMYQWGVESLVSDDLQHHIKQIERIVHMAMGVILSTKNAVSPKTALAIYAPHSGYTVWGVGKKSTLEIRIGDHSKKPQLPIYVSCVQMKMGN